MRPHYVITEMCRGNYTSQIHNNYTQPIYTIQWEHSQHLYFYKGLDLCIISYYIPDVGFCHTVCM